MDLTKEKMTPDEAEFWKDAYIARIKCEVQAPAGKSRVDIAIECADRAIHSLRERMIKNENPYR